jgi:MoxR-like ATPase
MEEHQITVEGVTRQLPNPFIVLATQNPIEYEGTFPLPEAQLDRFLLRIQLGYPSFEEEIEIIDRQQFTHPLEDLEEVATPEDLLNLQIATKSVYLDDLIKTYIVNLVAETRHHPDIGLGASPRAALALVRTTQTLAFLRSREYVIPDDVKELAAAVLAHRIIVAPSARMRGLDNDQIIKDVIGRVTVPGVRVGRG